MKIEKTQTTPYCNINCISIGHCFMFQDMLYFKIRNFNGNIDFIDLVTGLAKAFNKNTMVLPVDAKVVI